MKFYPILSFAVRLIVAIVVGAYMMQMAEGAGLFGVVIALLYAVVLFLLFGIPMIERAGQAVTRFYVPDDSHFRIMPEYSIAEARVKREVRGGG